MRTQYDRTQEFPITFFLDWRNGLTILARLSIFGSGKNGWWNFANEMGPSWICKDKLSTFQNVRGWRKGLESLLTCVFACCVYKSPDAFFWKHLVVQRFYFAFTSPAITHAIQSAGIRRTNIFSLIWYDSLSTFCTRFVRGLWLTVCRCWMPCLATSLCRNSVLHCVLSNGNNGLARRMQQNIVLLAHAFRMEWETGADQKVSSVLIFFVHFISFTSS